jgi:hypothetical protein
LNARHILTGKLAAAGLQMLVYLSALFPCLAFTYLLRGLDIISVFLVVFYTCLLSLGMAMLGLLLATLTPSRQRQIVQGVLFAILLVWVFAYDIVFMGELVDSQGTLWETRAFWEVNAALALFYGNAFAIVFLCARALLTAVCQNRSTALRVALVVAQLSFTGWVAWAALKWGNEILYGLVFVSTVGWYCAGALLVGESPLLSPRVKRDLPQSELARVALTWFAPGPGTGYMFAIANVMTMCLLANLMATEGFREIVALTGAPVRPPNQAQLSRYASSNLSEACIVALSYLTIYLGLGKLILGAVRKFDDNRLTLRILIHILLIGVGGGIPWVVQMSNPATRGLGYTLLQITNPVWTLFECCLRGSAPANYAALLVTLLPLAALLVWILNLPSLAAELRQGRIAKPPRVAEEDAQQAAARAPEPVRASPWDD